MEKLEQQNKYYQPSIEEFCVGFEFEERYLDWKDKWSGWSKRTINNLINLDTFNRFIHKDFKYYEDIKEYEFRVKYLDSQDIIDCGFGNKRKSVWDWYELNKTFRMRSGHHISKIKLIHDRSNEFLEVTDGDICPNIKIWGDFSGTDEVLFEGLIKNKTEFKKILKQIGVL